MNQGKFHIDKHGNPAVCSASVRDCPRGGFHGDAEDVAREVMRRLIESDTEVGAEPAKTQGSWKSGEIKVEALGADTRRGERSVMLPAGKYFVCDPGYILQKDEKAFDEWIHVAYSNSANVDFSVTGGCYNGYPVASVNTGGDGNFGGYPVDGGQLGVVSEEIVRGLGFTDDELKEFGDWTETDEPMQFHATERGELYFGPLAVDVGGMTCYNCGQNEAEDGELCEYCAEDEE